MGWTTYNGFLVINYCFFKNFSDCFHVEFFLACNAKFLHVKRGSVIQNIIVNKMGVTDVEMAIWAKDVNSIIARR